jgi:hypothetical protein
MRINLSKKNKIIVIILLVLVLGGTGGYLLWRVNQDKTVAPTDSDASSCHAVCNQPITACGSVLPGNNCEEGCAGYTSGSTFGCCEYHMVCSSTCGDGTCSSDETATSCAADCACKALTWTNKPSGTFEQGKLAKSITIANPNSTSTTTTGVAIKFNDTTLSTCSGGDTKACFKVGKDSNNKQLITLELLGNKTALDVAAYTLSVTLPGPKDTCVESTSFTLTKTIVCGDNVCDVGEATTCPSDCVCKAFVWTNKPSGVYKSADVPSTITISNPNSSEITTQATAIKLNETTLSACGSSDFTTSCYNYGTDASSLTIHLATGLGVGSYSLSVSLPTQTSVCKEIATFSVGDDTVPDTGIFDGVMGRIYLGSGFVFLGIITTQFPKFTYMFGAIGERNRVIFEEKRRKREEEKRNRFERRFK